MAFSDLPTELFTGIALDGSGDSHIKIPISSIPELTSAEADPATGKLRKLWYAMCERAYQWWNAHVAADRPTTMGVSKSSVTTESTGITRKTYTFWFDTVASGVEVDDEPT